MHSVSVWESHSNNLLLLQQTSEVHAHECLSGREKTERTIVTVADSLRAIQPAVDRVDAGVVVGALGSTGHGLALRAKHASRAATTDVE